jgi:hypothetical protein
LLIPLLHLRARLQHRAGLRSVPTSEVASRLAKFCSVIGDSRTLWRLWGLIPTVHWLISLEHSTPQTNRLLTIERLQGWSMLGYYPLEHLSYLSSHGILPSSVPSIRSLFSATAKPINVDSNVLGRWSCRFWALYVGLQFAHLQEDLKLLVLRHRNMRRAKGSGLTPAEKDELRQRWDAYWSQVIINLADLPLTIHWSLEKGLFTNEIWVTIFGLISAIASFRSSWRATALPSAPPTSTQTTPEPPKDHEKTIGYDLSN